MRKIFVTATLLALASSAVAAEEQKVFKWEDEDGNVYYGDSVPQQFAERPKEVLNEHGVTVAELEGRKTEEQLAQEQIDKERRERQEQQLMADRALLSTYLSVEEIVMHRDRRIELFQAQSRVTELYLRNLERRLKELREEASRYRPYSEDENAPMIDEGLAQDLRETKDTIDRHQRNLMKYESDEKQIVERFDGDIARFKRLKGID
ncbi:MAG: DUF4124 domain-containing protein [Gammaproteobacteria bacterium]|nr:DUF4124 domain-containing protein [Gammaproteobacteria bacterium]MDH5617349.1 DUF4124 domain-containing protein [Gammaproteobacteria bacterium]